MRNVEKTIEQGRKLISENPETDLIVSEMQQFYDDFQTGKVQSEGNAVFNLMGKVFYFGVAVGYQIDNERQYRETLQECIDKHLVCFEYHRRHGIKKRKKKKD